MLKLLRVLVLLSIVPPAGAQTVAPWATYRGNAQRTGNADGQAGPASAKVLWVHKSKEHYIASPLPVDDKLFVSGLGAFNLGALSCLSTQPKVAERTLWTKSTPYLKLPTVSSPGLMGRRLIFGDGMHQTDGATLYCMDLVEGVPLWRLDVPGTLVHLEGSPTIHGGKAYIGGGAAGVLCVQADQATVGDKRMNLEELQAHMAAQWKALQAKYEAVKTKDEFATPPTEDQLPKATPAVLWQQGKVEWHVDAPVAVAGDCVLAASAFLDKEQTGERALFCLDAASGKMRWRSRLKLNPWGGPSVLGDVVVVSGSSIGYDPKALKGAKGFIAAFKLSDGSELWSKDITGGVLGCAALAGNSAVVTATDGKIRAFALDTGERQWIYDAKSPLFAPPAIAKDTVYAGDLKGVVHAVQLQSGLAAWTMDLGTQAEVQAPGMVYGGPVVERGRLYVATCNLEGPNAREPTAVICIGE